MVDEIQLGLCVDCTTSPSSSSLRTQPLGNLLPVPMSMQLAIGGEPSESADADDQCADQLVLAFPLFPDHETEACLVHSQPLINSRLDPFGWTPFLSASHKSSWLSTVLSIGSRIVHTGWTGKKTFDSSIVPVSRAAPHRVVVPHHLIGFVPAHRFNGNADVLPELERIIEVKGILRWMSRMHRHVT